MATAVFYPSDADVYFTERENEDALDLYTDAHSAIEADSHIGAHSANQAGQVYSLPFHKLMAIRRGPLIFFDTSSLSGAEVTSASLRLRISQQTSAFYTENFDWYLKLKGGSDLNVLTVNQVSNYPTLLTAGTEFDSKYAEDLTTTATNYTFSVPVAYVSTTGNTVILALNGNDEAGIPPDYSGGQTLEHLLFYLTTTYLSRAPKLTVVYTPPPSPGFIWTEGDKFHFGSEIREQKILGIDTTVNATAGHLFVEGNNLHFVSQNGDEHRQGGKLVSGATGTAGHIYIDDMWIYYVDSSGRVRKLGTWMLGGSHLGVDTILHA